MDHTEDTEVLVVGAGPVGLSLANLLGGHGRSVTVVEARSELIDHPRGVGLDDESFRTLQAMGLAERVAPHTVPQHVMRLVNGRGRVLVTNEPTDRPLGWPRRNGFVQQLVDRELLAGLDRYDTVRVRFSHELIGIEEHDDHVLATVAVTGDDGSVRTTTVRARYLVGCEGGRSFTRDWMGVTFEGHSPSTRWLVIDVDNDPLGTPNVYLGADPRRPYVSIGLPHGIRRWEFMLHDDEPDTLADDPGFVQELLAGHVPDPAALTFIGRRVYSHHGRIAGRFRSGRMLIAGDAAHLMPVWLGQGWNSGIRDATNLAWKLDAVLSGRFDDALLDTYDAERRDHARAMIDLNMTAGSIMKAGPRTAAVRDVVAAALGAVPAVKRWFTEMRFKPVPRYRSGVVVDADTGRPGTSGGRLARRLTPVVDAVGDASPVGLQFVQPRVHTATGRDVLLDDVIGTGWAVAAWGNDPARLLGPGDRDRLDALGARLVCLVPESQRPWAEQVYARSGTVVVGDADGALKRWFDTRPVGVVVLRPDRFVAAACLAQELPATLRAVLTAASRRPAPATTEKEAEHDPRGRLHVA